MCVSKQELFSQPRGKGSKAGWLLLTLGLSPPHPLRKMLFPPGPGPSRLAFPLGFVMQSADGGPQRPFFAESLDQTIWVTQIPVGKPHDLNHHVRSICS